MKSLAPAVVAILAVGNLLLWGERLALQPPPATFDFPAFEDAARRAFDGTELISDPFAPSPLYPPTHTHLLAKREGGSVFSVYLAQYPRLDLDGAAPHNPLVCYQSLGLTVEGGPEVKHIEHRGAIHAVWRLQIAAHPDDPEGGLTVFYWSQFAGGLPGPVPGLPGALDQARAAYGDGRRDLVWVRVELRGRGREIDAVLRRQLLALMTSAASSMRSRSESAYDSSR